MVETLLLCVLIIAIAVALMCVRIIFVKNGRFSSQHIHDSAAMRRRGISCAKEQDRQARRQGRSI